MAAVYVCSFTMYEDDGLTRDYVVRGVFSTYVICWEDDASVLTVSQREGSFDGYVKVSRRSWRKVMCGCR